jgi:hypothetical protein
MRFTSAAVVVVLLAGIAEASAQQCQTRALPFDTEAIGELESSDCRFPPTCEECPANIPGEYWAFDATEGEGVYFTVRPGTLWYVHVYIIDSEGRRVSEGALYFMPRSTGTYRFLVVSNAGPFGTYAIARHRWTTPLTPGLWATVEHGNNVALAWNRPASPTPILEYLLEVGSVSGASDLGVFSLGTTIGVTVSRVPSGIYFFRLRARNGFGLGLASREQVIATTDRMLRGPTNLGVVAVSTQTVTLSWTEPPEGEVLFYELLISATFGGPNIFRSSVGGVVSNIGGVRRGTTISTVFTNVPSAIYSIRVRAVTTAGPTKLSNEVGFNVF